MVLGSLCNHSHKGKSGARFRSTVVFRKHFCKSKAVRKSAKKQRKKLALLSEGILKSLLDNKLIVNHLGRCNAHRWIWSFCETHYKEFVIYILSFNINNLPAATALFRDVDFFSWVFFFLLSSRHHWCSRSLNQPEHHGDAIQQFTDAGGSVLPGFSIGFPVQIIFPLSVSPNGRAPLTLLSYMFLPVAVYIVFQNIF